MLNREYDECEVYMQNRFFIDFTRLFRRPAQAMAVINGGADHSGVRGFVRFYTTPYGVMVRTEVTGLPAGSGKCDAPVFGFHIHTKGDCSGAFENTGAHYDSSGCPHPFHAGDLPPLFSAGGRAVSVFLADRFSIRDIIGCSVVIHSSPDDFKTQPSGNSGTKIACGLIVASR